MVRGSAPSAAPNSAAPAASESTNSTNGVPPAPSSGSSRIADAGPTLFPGVDLGSLSGSGVSRLFGTGLPEFEQSFHCRHGKAYLFHNVVNVTVGEKEDRLMMTVMHTVVDILCVGCGSFVGWKCVKESLSLKGVWIL